MVTSFFKLPVLCVLLSFISITAHSDIIWEEPHIIAGDLTEFNNEGILKQALNGGGPDIDINTGNETISFVNSEALGSSADDVDPQDRGRNDDYETLLNTFTHSDSNTEVSLTDLTVGNDYVVQIWIADTRPRSLNRQKTIDSGAGTNSITLDSGLPSEYGIGRFRATSSTQVLRFVGGGGSTHPIFNALMLRDLGPPQPGVDSFQAATGNVTSPSGVNVASGTAVTLSWNTTDADSVSIDQGVGNVVANGTTIVAPIATTTYTLTSTNDNGVNTESVTVYVNDTADAPEINEIVADNDNSLEDLDGDSSDWIELYNPNPYPIDIGDYRLTDDPALATSWDIPQNTFIEANGYIVIFASGKDLVTNVEDLHTDFRLSSNGDYVALLNDSGSVVVGQVPEDYPATEMFPELGEDVSYGINSNGVYRFYARPTPGAENLELGVTGFVEDTSFSHDRGFYDTGFSLIISSDTLGATIRYTLDGSVPTETNGLTYTSPISISETSVVRAYATFPDFEPTNVDTHTYLFAADIIAGPNMDPAITEDPEYAGQMIDSLKALPVISLNIEDVDNLNNSNELGTSIEWIDPDGANGFQHDAGVTHFGGFFTDFDKKSFRIYFRRRYGVGKLNFPLFDGFSNGRAPTDTFDEIDLRNGSHDMSSRGAYLSNRFTDDSLLEMGHVAPHGRFVHVIRNGEYWGQYHLRERWSASFAEEYLGGEEENYDAINGNANLGGWAVGRAYDGTDEGWNLIRELANGDNPWEDLLPRVDMANYIDFMLLYNSGRSENEFRAVLQPVDNGVTMKMFLNDADGFLRNGSNNNSTGPGGVFEELLEQNHPDFMTLLADRIQLHYFGNGAYTASSLVARLQNRYDETRLPFLSESARWGERTPDSFNGYQENLIDNELLVKTADKINDFTANGWFPETSAPTFNQNGGTVSDGFNLIFGSDDGGVIYYTTDGSDPRLPGGGINPNAIAINVDGVNTTPIVVTGSEWRYLDDGSNQGTAWQSTGFDDCDWASGDAELGYGDGDEETTVSFGGNPDNKHITTYFRKTFNATDTSLFTSLSLSLQRDDGAVVYINGVEVARSNMPAGTPTFTTFAPLAIGGDAERAFQQFTIPVSAIQNGSNTIAVEIHQFRLNSSDISFDLSLTGVGSSTSALLVLGSDVTVNARLLSNSEWSPLNSADFVISEPPVAPLPGNLIVSEIHYNPANPTNTEEFALTGVVDDDFEYLEVMNVSGSPLQLDGSEFTEGVGYVFPEDSIIQPNERLVIVRSLEGFALRHPEVEPNGEFTGGLKNSTEGITLTSSSGETLLSLVYSDGEVREGVVDDILWPTAPDGDGPSLVLIHPRFGVDLSDPREWRASASDDGSPEDDDNTPAPPEPSTIDDDGDGFSALLELTLGSSDDNGGSFPEYDIEVLPYAELGGKEYLTITFTRNTNVASSVLVESTSDLKKWEELAVFVERDVHNDGTQTLKYRHPVAVDEGGGLQFLRVNVTE